MGFFGSLVLVLLIITALFLIVLVLIQRGKGGGLAGAFGGMGGQSAFGTKAGDLFTKVTIVTATLWIFLCLVAIKVLGTGGGVLNDMGTKAENRPSATAPVGTGEQPAGGPSSGTPDAAEQQPAGGDVPATSNAPAAPSAPAAPEKSPAEGDAKP